MLLKRMEKPMNRFGLFIAFVIVFVVTSASLGTAAAAVGTASIVGVVESPSGEIISAAKIELLGSTSSFATTSGKNGRFQFLSLDPGTYVLRTSATQYERTESNPLLLAAGQSLDVTITLQPVSTANISTIGRVTVS